MINTFSVQREDVHRNIISGKGSLTNGVMVLGREGVMDFVKYLMYCFINSCFKVILYFGILGTTP